ncbi:MAG: O-methyltransferase [Elusimicrobia bacterium]|nr:O-methyltransferase [Elusimicrobiota bacterium]
MTKDRTGIFSGHYLVPELTAYLSSLSSADEGYASHVVEAMEKAGVRSSSVSAAEGKLLEALARLSQARKAVEIGSLYGYSAHWLARGLPDGARLYSLEKDPACVSAAKEGMEVSALSRKVTVIEGPALESLKTLAKLGPFDLCYIDGDLLEYPAYLRWAASNLRPGGLALAGGVFFKGRVCYEGDDPALNAGGRAMREFFHVLYDSDRFVTASVIPGGEGFALGIKG